MTQTLKKSFRNISFLISVILITGCASFYKPINPSALKFNATENYDGLELSYKYDVLRTKGNKKYARKELKKGLKPVAVKVTNHSDTTIVIGCNTDFYSGQIKLMTLQPDETQALLKQHAAAYLPYLSLAFVNLTVTTETTSETYPVGLVLGPSVTLINMVTASSANKKMLSELNQYNLLTAKFKRAIWYTASSVSAILALVLFT